jgi:hypothetical protein
MLREKNNPAGLMDPKTGMSTGQSFPDVATGIAAAGRSIGKNYRTGGGTIPGMARTYAPPGAANDPGGLNKGWPEGVSKFQTQLSKTPQTASEQPTAGGVARGYERRRGEPGEFNAAESGIFGTPGTNLTKITLKNGKTVTVNAAGAEQFKALGDDLIDRGYKIGDIGGYNYRTKRGGGGLSEHAYGTAVDINPERNPFGGKTTDLPEDVEEMAWRRGLSWGGRFGDPMHFELMSPAAAANKLKILAARDAARSARFADWPDRQLDRSAVDKASRQQVDVNATGKLVADIKAPPGTRVGLEGDGLFKDTQTNRMTQMTPAEEGPEQQRPY